MQDKSYVPFTEEMKRDYTILVPNMLPMHFKLIIACFKPTAFIWNFCKTVDHKSQKRG